jgi:hypothetical protein
MFPPSGQNCGLCFIIYFGGQGERVVQGGVVHEYGFEGLRKLKIAMCSHFNAQLSETAGKKTRLLHPVVQ